MLTSVDLLNKSGILTGSDKRYYVITTPYRVSGKGRINSQIPESVPNKGHKSHPVAQGDRREKPSTKSPLTRAESQLFREYLAHHPLARRPRQPGGAQ